MLKSLQIYFAVLVSLSTLTAWGSTPQLEVFRKSAGSVVGYQYSPAQKGRPTFLFLPGVNRGTLLEDAAIQLLAKSGAGIIAFNFSVQPLSIALLPPREDASLRDMSLESLAEETLELTRRISTSKRIPMSNIIPVSLSYSGAISPLLKDFPLIVDMVPLTSFAAFSPQLAAYYSTLKGAELFNPIFGPGITRSSLDAAYRSQWIPQVEGIVRQYQLPTERRNEMVEGYTSLSRAVEGYSWRDSLPAKKVKRVFVLAENEASSLLRDQVETIEMLNEKGYDASVIVVGDSGHIIPADQPQAYVEALLLAAEGESAVAEVTVLSPKTGTKKAYDGAKAKQVLRELTR